MSIQHSDFETTALVQVPLTLYYAEHMWVVWDEGNGTSEPNSALMERLHKSIQGHPALRIFCDDVPDTIIPGKNDSPRYFNLDYKASFAIQSSRACTRPGRRNLWLYCDHKGTNKSKRSNRRISVRTNVYVRSIRRRSKKERGKMSENSDAPGKMRSDVRFSQKRILWSGDDST